MIKYDIDKFGKKVIDISQLVDVFEAQEGEIQQIIGKTGNGKTYEGTRRALRDLKRGNVVYTTWHLILPDFYDERQDRWRLFVNTILGRKRFYKFNLRENWHFLDIERPDLIEFVAGLTDCTVYLDEGQDIFDSRERIDKSSRKTLTRTRHMRKTLVIISQRAQAVEVTARANVTYFFKCVKTRRWYWPFRDFFKIYRTEEMDQQNFPIWEEPLSGWKAELWYSHFARKEVYESYNSWYLRSGMPRSQEIYFEANDLNLIEKIKLFFISFFVKKDRTYIEKRLVEMALFNQEKYGNDISKAMRGYVRKEPEKPIKRLRITTKKAIELSTGIEDTKDIPMVLLEHEKEGNKDRGNTVRKAKILKERRPLREVLNKEDKVRKE